MSFLRNTSSPKSRARKLHSRLRPRSESSRSSIRNLPNTDLVKLIAGWTTMCTKRDGSIPTGHMSSLSLGELNGSCAGRTLTLMVSSQLLPYRFGLDTRTASAALRSCRGHERSRRWPRVQDDIAYSVSAGLSCHMRVAHSALYTQSISCSRFTDISPLWGSSTIECY